MGVKAARAALAAVILIGSGAMGDEASGPPKLGPETNLPLPRFVSLKSENANVRRGPGLTHRVDWVFIRRGMPLEVIAEHGHWRRVRDVEDSGGWVHFAMLRGERSGVVTTPRAALRKEPDRAAALVALAEAGAILHLKECRKDWCEAEADGVEGWLSKSEFWGALPDETFD